MRESNFSSEQVTSILHAVLCRLEIALRATGRVRNAVVVENAHGNALVLLSEYPAPPKTIYIPVGFTGVVGPDVEKTILDKPPDQSIKCVRCMTGESVCSRTNVTLYASYYVHDDDPQEDSINFDCG